MLAVVASRLPSFPSFLSFFFFFLFFFLPSPLPGRQHGRSPPASRTPSGGHGRRPRLGPDEAAGMPPGLNQVQELNGRAIGGPLIHSFCRAAVPPFSLHRGVLPIAAEWLQSVPTVARPGHSAAAAVGGP